MYPFLVRQIQTFNCPTIAVNYSASQHTHPSIALTASLNRIAFALQLHLHRSNVSLSHYNYNCIKSANGCKMLRAMESVYLSYEEVVGHGLFPENSRMHVHLKAEFWRGLGLCTTNPKFPTYK